MTAKKKTDTATVERFERAIRRALSTPPETTRKKTRPKSGRKK